jgi:hypothetical protein
VFSRPSAGRLAHLGQIECGDEAPIALLSFPGGAQVPPARARAHVPIINLAIKSYRGRTPLAGWREIANYSPRIRGARAQSIAKAAAGGVSGRFLSACPWQTPSILPPDLIATLDLHLPSTTTTTPHPLGRRQRPEAVAPGAPSPPEPRGPLLYRERLPNHISTVGRTGSTWTWWSQQ